MYFFIFLISCSYYKPVDYASDTAHICQFTNHAYMALEVLSNMEVSKQCKSKIQKDFRTYNLDDNAEQTLVNYAYVMLSYDWHNIDHPALNDDLNTLVSELNEMPHGHLLYNWSAAHFSNTTVKYKTESIAAYNPYQDRLLLDELLTPLQSSYAFAHEAKHAEGFLHVKCNDTHLKDCDKNNLGAYGATIAILEALPTDNPKILDIIDDKLVYFETRIQY